jgi:hypothetical protein
MTAIPVPESSKARGSVLIAGAVIGFVGFIIPGLYGVLWAPPDGTRYAKLSLQTLKGFGGAFTFNSGGFSTASVARSTSGQRCGPW